MVDLMLGRGSFTILIALHVIMSYIISWITSTVSAMSLLKVNSKLPRDIDDNINVGRLRESRRLFSMKLALGRPKTFASI